MKQYHQHLKDIIAFGTPKAPSRLGLPGSLSLFGYQTRYDLSEGFPILTTKKVSFKNIVTELLWFLRGETNIKFLDSYGVTKLWHEDAYQYYTKLFSENTDASAGDMYWHLPDGNVRLFTFEEFCEIISKAKDKDRLRSYKGYRLGDCGFQYGKLWRAWDGYRDSWVDPELKAVSYFKVDQIKDLIAGIKKNPEGRRHIITAWDPAHLNDMALNACHAFVQFNVRRVESQMYLDCQFYQRSADMFLGVPYNISSYALLTHIVARILGMNAGHLIHTFGDSHIYDNHRDQVEELLIRNPAKYKLPELTIDGYLDSSWGGWGEDWDFDVIEPHEFDLIGYKHYPKIEGKLSTGLR